MMNEAEAMRRVISCACSDLPLDESYVMLYETGIVRMSERPSEHVDDSRLERLGQRRSGASLEVQWMARELQQLRAIKEGLATDLARLSGEHTDLAVELEHAHAEFTGERVLFHDAQRIANEALDELNAARDDNRDLRAKLEAARTGCNQVVVNLSKALLPNVPIAEADGGEDCGREEECQHCGALAIVNRWDAMQEPKP